LLFFLTGLFIISGITGCATFTTFSDPSSDAIDSGWTDLHGGRYDYAYEYSRGNRRYDIRDLILTRGFIYAELSIVSDSIVTEIKPARVGLRDCSTMQLFAPVETLMVEKHFSEIIGKLNLHHRNFTLQNNSTTRRTFLYKFDIPFAGRHSVDMLVSDSSPEGDLPPVRYRVDGSPIRGNGLGVGAGRNEITLSWFYNSGTRRLSKEVHFLPFTVIPRDDHNGNRTNISLLPLYGLLPAFLGGILVEGDEFPGFVSPGDSGAIAAVVRFTSELLIESYVLPNLTFHYSLWQNGGTLPGSTSGLVFLGWRTSLFGGRQADWMRFTPYAGVELFLQFTDARLRAGGFPPPALSLQLGIMSHFDFSNRFSPVRSPGFFAGTKLYLGM
jgi:hypothetical protein